MVRANTFLKLAPLWGPFLLLFAGGLALALLQSLGLGLGFEYAGGRWDGYAALLSPHFLASFVLALKVAFVSSLSSVALGAVLAYGIWRMPLGLQRWTTAYKLPLVLPHIAVGFIVLVFLSRSGLVASVAHHAGVIDAPGQFPALVFDNQGTGLILAYVYKETTFALLLALASLKRLNPDQVRTAQMLGASPARVFSRVVLPHMAPSLHAVFIILFLYTFGAFEIPFLLGGSSPAMPSVEAYNLYFQRDLSLRPQAMAILVTLFLFSIGFIALYAKAVSRMESPERKL